MKIEFCHDPFPEFIGGFDADVYSAGDVPGGKAFRHEAKHRSGKNRIVVRAFDNAQQIDVPNRMTVRGN